MRYSIFFRLHLASVRPDVCKGIEYVCEVFYGQVLGAMLPGINGPVDKVRHRPVAFVVSSAHIGELYDQRWGSGLENRKNKREEGDEQDEERNDGDECSSSDWHTALNSKRAFSILDEQPLDAASSANTAEILMNVLGLQLLGSIGLVGKGRRIGYVARVMGRQTWQLSSTAPLDFDKPLPWSGSGVEAREFCDVDFLLWTRLRHPRSRG